MAGGGGGVRRIRAGRVVAAAAGVALIATLALGYGLTPPKKEEKQASVKIDIRKQQGELPTPPALSMPADLNYATATQPPKDGGLARCDPTSYASPTPLPRQHAYRQLARW